MDPSDQEPTTTFGTLSPPQRRAFGPRARFAVIGIAAVVIAAAAGTWLAIADGGGRGHAGMPTQDAAGDPPRQAWAHQYGQDRAGMPILPDVASASPQQQAAAADLLARTESAAAGFSDPGAALAAGFDIQGALARAEEKNPGLAARLQRIDAGQAPKRMPVLFVTNRADGHAGKVLDPTAPEALIYQYHGHDTWKVAGVVYTAGGSYPQAPPDPGGPITRWSYRDNRNGGAALAIPVFFVPGNDLAHAYAAGLDAS
jgi:hypothetical protein